MTKTLRHPILVALLTALALAGALLPVSSASAAPVPEVTSSRMPASSKVCKLASQQKYVSSLAKKAKVPAPTIVIDDASPHGAYFTPGTSTISLRSGCTSKSTLAHEFGHYIIDLAANMDWSEHKLIASNFAKFPNWLKTSSDAEGFERAAHCVGYRFHKNGTYTKCPHRQARAVAAFVVAMASSRNPA